MSASPTKSWAVTCWPYDHPRSPEITLVIDADSFDVDTNSNLRFWKGTGKDGILVASFRSNSWSFVVSQ